MALETLIEQIRRVPNTGFGNGASDSEIEDAQRKLQVTFPTDYRIFLSRLGWGGIDYWELYGLGSDVPIYLDLVRITNSERQEMSPRLPSALLPVYNDGGGNLFCLNTEKAKNDSCPIVFWDHDLDENQEPEAMADSFEVWLSALIS